MDAIQPDHSLFTIQPHLLQHQNQHHPQSVSSAQTARLQFFGSSRRRSNRDALKYPSDNYDLPLEPKIIPKLNLNQIVTTMAPFKRSSHLPKHETSFRSHKKSPRDFELLKMNTFQLDGDLSGRRGKEFYSQGRQRRIIHVNKRPQREPFYCEPDKDILLGRPTSYDR